ncbi:MAG: 2-C-methyl-D-erythritol 2,4-cyclodiphosphate synthase [Clostridiales bacterium]|jgi:2-C-methyl-D-erythritol 2,4-cyclodiphosphate synthase|nr:2-C-methyl-D-erythritol 2,4-cyclodiphosphate synthase [Clostridiales bacterium]
MRIGLGYDVHRLVEGRPLILGGALIAFEKGLLGHSDADVLAHAIMDGLLGAAGAGDIGNLFPDSDPAYKDISSIVLLSRVNEVLKNRSMGIINIDCVVCAERPRLAPHIPEMRKNIAAALGIEPGRVNIKATTEEGLGFTGQGLGMSAQAAVLLEEYK